MFWIIIAVLTAVSALILIHPLLRKGEVVEAYGYEGEVAVYQDQLTELAREKDAGIIGDAEAEYARAEIGRRLIAASEAAQSSKKQVSSSVLHKLSIGLVVLLIPAIGLGFYISEGQPNYRDMPLQARLDNPGDNLDLLVAKVERHLAQNPSDGNGWELLAPIYFRAQKYAEAQDAFQNAIQYLGEGSERLTGLGESLVNINDGIVIENARKIFEKVLRLDPQQPNAQFYIALALEQSGRRAEAATAYQILIDNSPADASWLPLVRQRLASTLDNMKSGEGEVPRGPSEADISAAQSMSTDDRKAMIEGMVGNLEQRLLDEPDNFEGWMQLIRSYVVLGSEEKALKSLENAFKAFPKTSPQGQQLTDFARSLGLTINGSTP